MKLLFLYIFAFLFTSKHSAKNIGNIKRILLIRPDERLGNTIITTALAFELKQLYPKARIDFLVSKKYSSLVTNNSLEINILPFEKRSLFTSPLKWVSFFLRLRKNSYDLTIDATHEHAFSTTGMLISLFCNAPLRIGHKRNMFDRGYTHAVENHDQNLSEIKRKQNLLIPVKGKRELLHSPPLWASEPDYESKTKINIWLQKQKLESLKLGFVWPGGRKADRRFEPELYIELINTLHEDQKLKTIILWGNSEYERAKNIAEKTDSILAPDCNLPELTALLQRGFCFIGNDTGPLHLAYAIKLPTFSLIPDKDCLRWVYTVDPNSTAIVNNNTEEITREIKDWFDRISKDIK